MILAFLDEEPERYAAVRVAVENGNPLSPSCSVTLVEPELLTAADCIFDAGEFRVALDPGSANILQGGYVDWVESDEEAGFDVQSPLLAPPGSTLLDSPLALRVRMVIDRDINPFAATHGGAIRLVDVRHNTAYVEMSGRCQGCGMALVTLRDGLERMLKQAVPEIETIVDLTDHRSGRDPYYRGRT
jgi:Fe/S biogenesis protein NfuA